jgi:hypothetical protein
MQSIPNLFTRSVVHIHETKEIALEIAAKFVSACKRVLKFFIKEFKFKTFDFIENFYNKF